MLLRSLLKKNLKKLKPRKSSMEVLIPLGILAVVVALSVRRFKPELWNKVTSKFKK
jgi:hypothetical protein